MLRYSRWRHQIETFSALLVLCAGNSLVTGEFPTQKPETQSFDVFFDLRLNKRLSKQSWGWRFETPWRWFWRHFNVEHKANTHVDTCINTASFFRGDRETYQCLVTDSKWLNNVLDCNDSSLYPYLKSVTLLFFLMLMYILLQVLSVMWWASLS